MNFHLNVDRLTPEHGDATGGAGLGLKVGYGISPLFTLYLGVDGAGMHESDFGDDDFESADFGLGFAELGAQFNFMTSKPAAIPYIDVALTGFAAISDPDNSSEITFSGGGLSVGGGLKYFVSTTLALDVGLSITVGTFDTAEADDMSIDIDEKTTMSRLNFGISWYPFNQ